MQRFHAFPRVCVATAPSMGFTFLTTVLTILFLLSAVAHGVPVQISISQCDMDIQASTSPSYNWSSPEALRLSQNCLLARNPPPNACVFYTSQNREQAREYASDQGKFTIYDVYDSNLFDLSRFPAREWRANGSLRSVFRTTSRAYAMSCVGEAGLVIPRTETPCKSSIWWTDERDAIRRGMTNITDVVRVSFLRKVGDVLWWLVGDMEGVKEWVVEGSKVRPSKEVQMKKRDIDRRLSGGASFMNREFWQQLEGVLDEWETPTRGQCVL